MGRLGNLLDSFARPRPPRLSPDGHVLRFDIHQRVQHILMFTSLLTLVFTGWPLKAAGVGPSAAIAKALGGVENIAIIHRVAAVVMLVASAYHLLYLGVLAARKRLQFDIVPGPQDLKDISGMIRYYLGLQPEPPKFGRYTYFEKFDYWAVFWGIFIIGGSGLVLWFPVKATAVLPSWIVSLAFIAHSDEALLALMYLFIFHFYMVHLRPAIFPMSWVWLNGKMSLEEYEHEHGRDFERLDPTALAAARAKAHGGATSVTPPPPLVKEVEPDELVAAARAIVAAADRDAAAAPDAAAKRDAAARGASAKRDAAARGASEQGAEGAEAAGPPAAGASPAGDGAEPAPPPKVSEATKKEDGDARRN